MPLVERGEAMAARVVVVQEAVPGVCSLPLLLLVRLGLVLRRWA